MTGCADAATRRSIHVALCLRSSSTKRCSHQALHPLLPRSARGAAALRFVPPLRGALASPCLDEGERYVGSGQRQNLARPLATIDDSDCAEVLLVPRALRLHSLRRATEHAALA